MADFEVGRTSQCTLKGLKQFCLWFGINENYVFVLHPSAKSVQTSLTRYACEVNVSSFPNECAMPSDARWRPQPTMGSRKVPTTSLPCGIPAADWQGIITLRPNVLLNGPQPTTDAVLDALKPRLRRPHAHWVPEAQLTLPLQNGTLILHEIIALNTQQQEQLLQWLSHLSEPSQVVSTSSSSLYALVQDGKFSADLFYRVNVVVVEC